MLFAPPEDETEKNRLSLNNPSVHLVLGIISIVTGILKLLSPYNQKYIFFGDLLPAAACLIGGFILIFGIYRQDTYAMTESHKSLDTLALSLLRFRKQIGLGLFAAAALHFLFPLALFL